MTKLRSHILALYVASLVLAAGAWCAPAAASAPHPHGQEAGAGHAHEADVGLGHGAHTQAGEAPLHDCGMDETACACAGSADGVRSATVTARDDRTETGTPAPLWTLPQTVFAPQGPSPDAPPERRRRLTHSYDEIYGRTGRMLI